MYLSFQEIVIVCDLKFSEFLRQHGVPFVLGLVNEIEDAFSNHSVVLSALSFLDPSYLPDQAKDIPQYGTVSIRCCNAFLKYDYSLIKLEK